jgi:predicted nucleic acid-binding protein
MTAVFVDTSAILAFLSPTDAHHQSARAVFEHLRERDAPLFTTSYVLVETYALLDRRFGRDSIRKFRLS